MTKPRVKPLVWHPVKSEDALCHDHWVAPALGGAFHTAPDEDSTAGAWVLQWTICHEDFCMSYGGAITMYGTPEAAKAAAQDHYEALILAALDPTPDPALQALVEALRFGVDLIEGDSFGAEWKRGQSDFRRMARVALAALDKTD